MSSKKSGMDVLLSQRGKSIAPGQEIRLTLIKGKSGIVCHDPVNAKAPEETFPLLAKFPESVVKPNFAGEGKKRLYQQDAPKAQEDSDEEAAPEQQKKKRWRRAKAPRREWILQSEKSFLESVLAKKQSQKVAASKEEDDDPSRYEGHPEHNASHFCIFSASEQQNVQVTTLTTPYATQTFAQPRKSYTLAQAEQVLEDKRAHMTRYMMHNNKAGKGRLLGKLAKSEEGEDEDEDIMADVAFKNRKGAGGKARKELLSMADEGIAVDDDGVLGGTNDAEFGGRRHFGRLQAAEKKQEKVSEERGAVGNDGLAMADDFYQRDVKEEYEDLDYDANEQFDDDDVDLGESEMHVDPTSGFGQDDEEDPDEEEYDEETTGGAEGLATVAGFRALLAKARGEAPPDAEASEEGKKDGSSRPTSPKPSEAAAAAADDAAKKPQDALAPVMAAAEKAQAAASKQKTVNKKKPKLTGKELDEHGMRLLTVETVQREIWLQNGVTTTKRLMKLMDVNKKSTQERKNTFRDIVKELCVMETDNVKGKVLVLKQHYRA